MNRIWAFSSLGVTILIAGCLLVIPIHASKSSLVLRSSGRTAYYPHSYIIYTNGTNYYAENSTTGMVDFSNTNPATLLANVFGNLTNGGRVFIKAGTYILNTVISVNFGNIIIDGEGQSSILQLASGRSALPWCMVLRIANCQNVTIQNIHVDGNFQNNNSTTKTQYGIAIENCQHVKVKNCYVTNCRMFGIYVLSTTSTSNVYDVDIVGNHVINCLWNGISFYSMVTGAELHDCRVTNNYVEGSCDIALDTAAEAIATPSYGVQFINNTVNGYLAYPGYGSSGTPDADFGVRVESGVSHLVQGNIIYNVSNGIADGPGPCQSGNDTILNNKIWMNHTNGWAGIEAYANDNTIDGNTIYGGFAAWSNGIYVRGNSTIVKNNTIVNSGGVVNFLGICEAGDINPYNTTIISNDVHLCTVGDRILFASGKGQVVRGNIGYNPVGNIANPVSGSYLLDSGSGTIANNTVYTCYQSDKTIYISGGTVLQIQVNGQTLFMATGVSVLVLSGDTFKIVWSSAPTVNVAGN